MSKYLRYSGEFVSRAGTVWRTDIMQESTAAFTVGELTFPADEPLVVEWSSKDKEEVVCGSTATLKIISPGDRTYQDLYTIAVGSIRLDVYRDGALYWSGALDPEFYEEPYERANGYEVSLTFSDFGILDRIKYDLTGMQPIQDIILRALTCAGILYNGLDSSCVSSELYATDLVAAADVIRDPIAGISVRSENFTDEDGEVSSFYEAVEGVLQPLAVRMVQRAGTVWLYDLNGLYSKGTAEAVQWDGDSQTMGTDKVANNVKVTYSPYGNAELMSDDVVEYGGKYDIDHTNITSDAPADPTKEYGEYYSYYPDYDPARRQEGAWDYNLIDFTLFIHRKGSGLQNLYPSSGLYSLGDDCKYFHILPVTGGATECSGVAYAFRTGGHGGIDTGWPKWKVHSSVPTASLTGNAALFATNRAYLPTLRAEDAKRYFVRVVEEVLIDARYNPFSGSTSGNDNDYDNRLKICSAFVFIPVKITLYDAATGGNALYHYSNRETAAGAAKGSLSALGNSGKWVAGADPGGDCWLEYYNPDDLAEDCGIRGWQGNRHCIGRPDGRGGRIGLTWYSSFKNIDDGEYMPYPPVSGYLEIEVQAGVLGYDFGQDCDDCAFGSTGSQWHVSKIYNMVRWMLYKAPSVDIVRNNLAQEAADLDDIEYSGYINKAAKEDISIDTVCGTSTAVSPTARGEYYRTDSGEPLAGNMSRAGRKNCPEKLLIGTLYSQYASRKTTLSGEAVTDGGLHSYTERNQGGKRFMLKGETQDVITDCTEAEYCEFRPDEYDSIEEVE